jgi:hypothetical protein
MDADRIELTKVIYILKAGLTLFFSLFGEGLLPYSGSVWRVACQSYRHSKRRRDRHGGGKS